MKETIVNVLSRADHGLLLDDLNNRLEDVTAAVLRTGAKGKITIQIDLSKTKGMNTGVEVRTTFKATAPEPVRPSDLYFADDEGMLSRKDPRQPELPGTTNVAPIRS